LLHQLVIVIRERLQHGETRFFLAIGVFAFQRHDLRGRVLLVDVRALEREIDKSDHDLVRPDRDLAQHQRHARGRLQQLQRLADTLVRLVDLVEEQKARNLEILELAQDQLQLRNLLLIRLAHHDRSVDRGQRRAHVVGKLDRARTIDKRIAVAEECGGRDRKLDAHLVMPRLGGGVADARARVDRALTLDRAGPHQDALKQCGLAALERAHQCDAPWTPWTRASVT
jgi:hypothetical protein